MDLAALEAAGFEKTMTTEEWEAFSERATKRYQRVSEDAVTPSLGAQVAIDYVLKRGSVVLTTEQNTQDRVTQGLQTTIRHPEIVILENADDRRRVTCSASDTTLILALADELSAPIPRERRPAPPVVPGR